LSLAMSFSLPTGDAMVLVTSDMVVLSGGDIH
jgi:hypothetical protein